MLCPVCDQEGVRYGKNRNGTQRFFCRSCFISFSERRERVPRVFSDKQLTMEKATLALRLMMDGCSVRAVCRAVCIGQHTLLDTLLRVGRGCERLLHQRIVGVPCESVQCDELWSYVWCKERTRQRKDYRGDDLGDCYTWTAVESYSRLLVAYAVGKRDNATGVEFVNRLFRATSGRFQIDTDGLSLYRSIIPTVFGFDQDHAQIVKIFSRPADGEARYSPPEIVDVQVRAGGGNPDLRAASTSYVERANLTVRMMLRRFTRLTNAYSKSWRHHEAAIALLFAVYNFCRPHMTLTERNGRKTTPAMAAWLTDHVWSYRQLIEAATPPAEPAAAS